MKVLLALVVGAAAGAAAARLLRPAAQPAVESPRPSTPSPGPARVAVDVSGLDRP